MNLKQAGNWRSYLARALVGTLFGAGFLILALRNVDVEVVKSTLHQARLVWLFPLVPLVILTFAIRSYRWWLMMPGEHAVGKKATFNAFMIGALGNCILPGRLGDVLRGAVLGRRLEGVGTSGALASIVLEKVFDGIIILILLALVLTIAPFPDWLAEAGMLAATVFSIVLAVLAALSTARAERALERLLPKTGLLSILLPLFKKIAVGLHGLKTMKTFITLLVISSFIWSVEAVAMLVAFSMFGISVPPIAAIVTIVFLALATMLPAAPGYVGTYQFFIVGALSLFAVDESTALAMGIVLNVLLVVVTTLISMGSLLAEGGLSGALRKPVKSGNRAE